MDFAAPLPRLFLRLSGRVFVWLYLELVYYFLNVGDCLGKLGGLFALRPRPDATLQTFYDSLSPVTLMVAAAETLYWQA